jgi:hypothetical protein
MDAESVHVLQREQVMPAMIENYICQKNVVENYLCMLVAPVCATVLCIPAKYTLSLAF